MLAPHLTVAENLCLGRLPRNRFGFVDWTAARKEASTPWRGSASTSIPTPGSTRSAWRKGRWWRSPARCRAMPGSSFSTSRPPCSAAPSLTSSSTSSGTSPPEGVSFIYISHRLQEVFRICDRVTVLRDGAVVGTRDIGDVDPPSLIRMMVGRQLADIYPARNRRPGAERIVRARPRPAGRASRHRPRHSRRRDPRHLRHGRFRTYRTDAGTDRRRRRRLRILQSAGVANARPRNPREAIAAGMVLLPEDRKTEGCFLPQSVAFNITISRLRAIRNGAFSAKAANATSWRS